MDNAGWDALEQEQIQAERAKAFATHRLHECDQEDCYPCSGGLSLCTVCGGAEGAMPYECPGHRMTEAQAADVMACRRDFIAGEWRAQVPRA